jgi:hypothetical protein
VNSVPLQDVLPGDESVITLEVTAAVRLSSSQWDEQEASRYAAHKNEPRGLWVFAVVTIATILQARLDIPGCYSIPPPPTTASTWLPLCKLDSV